MKIIPQKNGNVFILNNENKHVATIPNMELATKYFKLMNQTKGLIK